MAEALSVIERKFVVTERSGLVGILGGAAVSARVRRGYVVATPDGSEVRLRAHGGNHYLSVVQGGSQPWSKELSISPANFDTMWPVTEGKRAESQGYLIPCDAAGEQYARVDVFTDPPGGLVLAGVDFHNPEAAAQFVPPEWFGAEVTDDEAFTSKALALNGVPPALAGCLRPLGELEQFAPQVTA